MWGKQKTPLLRGSCLNALSRGYFKSINNKLNVFHINSLIMYHGQRPFFTIKYLNGPLNAIDTPKPVRNQPDLEGNTNSEPIRTHKTEIKTRISMPIIEITEAFNNGLVLKDEGSFPVVM